MRIKAEKVQAAPTNENPFENMKRVKQKAWWSLMPEISCDGGQSVEFILPCV